MMKHTTLILSFLILSINNMFGETPATRDQQAAKLRIAPERNRQTKNHIHAPAIIPTRRASACDTITTLFAQDNGLDGAMFDVVAHTDVTISYLNANIDGNGDYRIYYRNGSYMGYENDSTVWIFAGSANIITNPVNTPTQIPINLNLDIFSGDTLGIYVVSPNTGFLKYTDATSGVEGDVFSDNGDLAILQGSGVSYPFDFVIGPRVWNGTIDYCTGTTGITNIKNNSVSVYPNPFHESLTFNFRSIEERIINLYDCYGSLIRSIQANEASHTLLKDRLVTGVYFYKVILFDGTNQSGKIILE